jgi:hypothetical protein
MHISCISFCCMACILEYLQPNLVCIVPSIWNKRVPHQSTTEVWLGSWWLGCPFSANTTAGCPCPSESVQATSRHAKDNTSRWRDYSWYQQSNASNGTPIGSILFRASNVAESRDKLKLSERHVILHGLWQSRSSTSHQNSNSINFHGRRRWRTMVLGNLRLGLCDLNSMAE